jgi:hypothetical protein
MNIIEVEEIFIPTIQASTYLQKILGMPYPPVNGDWEYAIFMLG